MKRARPPKWTAEVLDVFFEDATQKLVGPRPDYERMTTAGGSRDTTSVTDNAAAPGFSWSTLIGADTLETEVKRLAQQAAAVAITPSEFKGGGYEDCRRNYSVLAMLFAVIGEYDGDVRWHDSAPALRELFSRAGYNCKVGTDQTYQESQNRKQDLADLIGGARPQLPVADRAADWSRVADRPPLMQRLNVAHEERLTKWLANKRQFDAHREDVAHEAMLVALIAEVVSRDGFDYWDEEEYAQHARELREAAGDISTAVEQDNYEQARRAIGRATKACAACHEIYRG
jgi:hypothetical protein